MDRLILPLADRGFSIVIANKARAWIDLNRSENEFDPESMEPPIHGAHIDFSAKARGGLGLVPMRLAKHGAIYRGRLNQSEIRKRIAGHHRPYHIAISDALERMRKHFGVAVLLDCHSMPPLRLNPQEPRPGFVIGDRHGESADSKFSSCAIELLRRRGYHVARNAPYAGGYILLRHGKPRRAIHAIQLEICRSIYLDRELVEPGPNFGPVSETIAELAGALANEALDYPDAIAAE